jgi:serine-type D-Ala-D-Ala carboxypeptidase/endopeptidase
MGWRRSRRATEDPLELPERVRRFVPRTGTVVLGVRCEEGMRWRCRPQQGVMVPDPARAIFEIGSVTKALLGLRLGLMVRQGTVDLRERLVDQAESLARARPLDEPAIRLAHLATHTSGLPRLLPRMTKLPGYKPGDPYAHLTPELIFERLRSVRLDAKPGVRCRYSNLGGGILGDALCARYQVGFDELLAPVTSAVGMPDTRRVLDAEQQQRVVDGHRVIPGFRKGYRTDPWHLGALVGAGGLYSTGADLARLIDVDLDEGSALHEALALAAKPRFSVDARLAIGLFWHLLRRPDGLTLVWHNGRTGGSSAFVGFVPGRAVGIVALAGESTASLDRLAIGALSANLSVRGTG